ncbi:hypothetical protein ACIQUB_10075 [Rhizobium sp. NPDC090275]|uniref:hypothetical protein n=1 Tax=Rhizobium sp. NPDC090275 TaxID=3364498 RepID=UPI0013AFBA7A
MSLHRDTLFEWYIVLCIGAVVIFLLAADRSYNESRRGEYTGRRLRKVGWYTALFGAVDIYRIFFIDGPYTLRPFFPHIDASGIPNNEWLELVIILAAIAVTAVVMPLVLLSWVLAPACIAFVLGTLVGRWLWLRRNQGTAKLGDGDADGPNLARGSPKRPFGRKK